MEEILVDFHSQDCYFNLEMLRLQFRLHDIGDIFPETLATTHKTTRRQNSDDYNPKN
jgi:hypothetical protein